jgi:hypothetical protein
LTINGRCLLSDRSNLITTHVAVVSANCLGQVSDIRQFSSTLITSHLTLLVNPETVCRNMLVKDTRFHPCYSGTLGSFIGNCLFVCGVSKDDINLVPVR